MLDTDSYPCLDNLIAQAQDAWGARVVVDVVPLSDGFAQTTTPHTSQPFAQVRVNERFAEFRHAIAAHSLADLIRRGRGSRLSATLNTEVLDELEQQATAAFTDLHADQLPQLARILYDGMARQLVSALPGIMQHRVVAEECGDLRQQHCRFLDQLITLNQRYFAAASDPRYPAYLVRANHRLLGAETLALAALRQGNTTDLDAAIATVNLPEHLEALNTAKPLVRALLDGDADDLSYEQLVLLGARHAGLREDWLNWITPDGSEAQPSAPSYLKTSARPRLHSPLRMRAPPTAKP